MASDVLGFATKATKSAGKSIAVSSGKQKDITAIQKNAGALGDVIGEGADDSYKQFQQQQQQKQKSQQPQQSQPQPKAPPKSLFSKVKSAVGDNIVKPIVTTGEKALNTTAAAVGGTVGLGEASFDALHGNQKASRSTAAKTAKTMNDLEVHGLGNKGAYLTPEQANATGGGTKSLVKNFIKPGAKATADIAPLVVPVGAEAKGASLLARVGKTAAANAGVGASSTAASEALDGKVNLKDVAKSAVLGGVIGGAIPVIKVGAHAGTDVTTKAVNDVMSKVRAPKELIQNAKTQSLLKAAADKKVAAAAVESDKAVEQSKKLDQQIELINAKKADGKFTNVDKVKVAQLKAQKEELSPKIIAPESAPPTKPAAAAPASAGQTVPAEPAGTARSTVSESSTASVAPKATVVDTVPTIKAYGREIKLSEENGYNATDTPNGKIYSKVARTGRNNKDSNLSMNYYDASGTKLTHEQAQAAINGSGTIKAKAPATTQGSILSRVVTKPVREAEVTPAELGTRSLTPAETAHMPEISGYTHSEHMAQDYADMLRDQESQAKGGQMIKNPDGSYRRTSEHSRFYRDFYKETGKAPTKADYLEQAKKELEAHKDGTGAGEDYQKLREREAKPVERVKVEPTVTDGPQGTSKVAQRIAKDIKEQYGDLAQYDKISVADQAKKAEALIGDREKLDRVISGEEPLPAGLRATSVITAVRNSPELLKDTELLKKLASSPLASESSLSAQELRLARENARHDPVMAIKNLRDIRTKAAEKRLGKPIKEAENSEIRQIKQSVPKVRPQDWSELIERLKC